VPGAARAATVLLEDRDGVIWCGSSEGLLRVRPLGASQTGSQIGSRTGDLVLEEVPLALDPTEHGRVVGALLEARDARSGSARAAACSAARAMDASIASRAPTGCRSRKCGRWRLP
jgi:hypothetical protein